MRNHIVKFDNFLNEAARMGSSSWKSVMNDLKHSGWDIKGNVASKDTESEKDPDDYITIELTSTRTGSEYVKYTVTNSSGKVIDSGEIDADGLSAGELDSEIWNHIDEGETTDDIFEGDEVAPDKILSPADKKRLKTAFENVVTGVDKLTFKKNGTIEGKRGYFYRHGQTPEKVAEQLKTALLSQGIEIEIVDAYDDFKPWPKDSNFVVVFRITK
jgi:hypothetical protein